MFPISPQSSDVLGDTGTIGALIDNRYSLWAYCFAKGCHHGQEFDLEELAAKLGRDHGAMHNDLVPKLRCAKCGSKDVGLTGIPYYGPSGLL